MVSYYEYMARDGHEQVARGLRLCFEWTKSCKRVKVKFWVD